jgi:streptogramin lyase
VTNFDAGTLTRIHPSTRAVETIETDSLNPGPIVVAGDVVWVGDWSSRRVERVRAVGAPTPHSVYLPGRADAGVWNVAAGEGYVWATMPRDGALWRIDPKSNEVTRIAMPHLPSGVITGAGDVWVTVRKA